MIDRNLTFVEDYANSSGCVVLTDLAEPPTYAAVEMSDLRRWLIDGEWEVLYPEDRPRVNAAIDSWIGETA